MGHKHKHDQKLDEEKVKEEKPQEKKEEIPKTQEREPKPVTITDIELETLKKEAKEYKDKYLHSLADLENARKRLQKERGELMKYAVESLMVDFLHPLDNMENALGFAEQMSKDIKNWAEGFRMILTQFKDILASNGVVAFDSEGKAFDPHHHEAIETIETDDAPPGTIVKEYLRGYRMGDKTIRPARVKVAKAPAIPAENSKKTPEWGDSG